MQPWTHNLKVIGSNPMPATNFRETSVDYQPLKPLAFSGFLLSLARKLDSTPKRVATGSNRLHQVPLPNNRQIIWRLRGLTGSRSGRYVGTGHGAAARKAGRLAVRIVLPGRSDTVGSRRPTTTRTGEPCALARIFHSGLEERGGKSFKGVVFKDSNEAIPCRLFGNRL